MIIGLTGKARSGKDTVRQILERTYGFEGFAFADALKQAMVPLFGIDPRHLYDDKKKEQPIPGWGDLTMRRAMQLLGTEAMRGTFGDDFWIKRLRKEIYGKRMVVISDVRFDNEAAAIRNWGGAIVEVKRTSAGLQDDAGAHASEKGVSPYLVHLTIDNNSSLAMLQLATEQAFTKLADAMHRLALEAQSYK